MDDTSGNVTEINNTELINNNSIFAYQFYIIKFV